MLTAKHIIEALQDYYRPGVGWVTFTEFRCGTGFGKRSEQRMDLYAIHAYPSQQNKRMAFEVKVSRQDFLHELEDPLKRRGALLLSNQFYFVTPVGLVDAKEIPIECGLIEVSDRSKDKPEGSGWKKMGIGRLPHWMREVVDAPVRESILPTWKFVASLARRISRMEEARCSSDSQNNLAALSEELSQNGSGLTS